MSLRVRLEGAYEVLENAARGARELRARLVAGWRSTARVEETREWLEAMTGFVEELPRAYAKVAALRDRVTRPEQRELDRLAARATKALRELDARVDQVLLASAAEMLVGLDHKLRRLSLLLERWQLDSDERELLTCEALLLRKVPGRWFAGHATLPREYRTHGWLILTQERVLYEDGSRRVELPLPRVSLQRGEQADVLEADGDRFEANLENPAVFEWCLALAQAFKVRGRPEPFVPAEVPVRRLGDGVDGRLLAWPEGVVYVPTDGAGALSAALARRPLGGTAEAVKALRVLLPWIGRQLLTRMTAQRWGWVWRREDIVLDGDDVLGELYLRHRSGSVDEPVYVVPAATRRSAGRRWARARDEGDRRLDAGVAAG